MKKSTSRILGIILTAGVVITSLPSTAWAGTTEAHSTVDAGSAAVEDIAPAGLDTAEIPVSGAKDAEFSDTADVADIDGPNGYDTVSPDSAGGAGNVNSADFADDSDSASADKIIIKNVENPGSNIYNGPRPNTLNADYYVSGGDYTYKGDMSESENYKDIFSGIYNDVQIERHGGRFFTGEEVVSLSGLQGSSVSLNRITDGEIGAEATASEIANSGAKVCFEVNDIPAEFVQDKTVTWQDDEYVEHTTELDDQSLIRKLYVWEYQNSDINIYHRVSSQEITSDDYFFYAPKDLGDGKTASTVSGNIVVDTSELLGGKINPDNPIAIVAYMYDASTEDSLFEGLWSYSDDRIFYTLEQIESESKRYTDVTEDYYNDKTPYYDSDIYIKSEMGTFSVAAYTYRRDDAHQVLTLYDTSTQPNYGLMHGYTYGWRLKNMDDYMLDEWIIPSTWTDPLTNQTYLVALGECASYIDAVSGEKHYLGGRRYPILASKVTISYGVSFPDDCTLLLTTGHTNMEMMCLKSLKIEGGPNGEKVGSNITNMNSMFYGNNFGNMGYNVPVTKLSTLDISALDTSNVTNMRSMFYAQWVSDAGPDVSGFDTSKVTDLSYMFYDAHIANPDVSHFDTSNTTDMAYMFGAAGVWTDYRVKPHAYAQGVYSALDLSSFDFSKVESMAGMFINQRLLSSIKFPDDLDTSRVKDMSELFMSCSSLTLEGATNLTLLDTSSVVDMFGMFGCFHWRNWGAGDKRVVAADYSGDEDRELARDCYYSHSDGRESESRGPAIKRLDLEAFTNFDTSKVKNMALMFDLPDATEISFGNRFDTSKVTDMNRMFNLPKVQSLNVSCFDTSSLTKATLMFDLDVCTDLNLGTNFDLSKIRADGTTYMFTTPVLSELDLSHVNFGSNADALCASTIAYFNLGYLETGCKELERLSLPAGMPLFNDPAALPETMYDEGGDSYEAVYGGNAEALTLTRSSAPLKNVYGFYTDDGGSDKLISETTIYANDQADGNNMVYLKLKMDPVLPAPAPSVSYTVTGYRDGEEVPGTYVVTTFDHNDGIEVYAYSGTLDYDSYALITANVRRSDGEVFSVSCKVRVEKAQSEELKLTDSDGNTFTCFVNKDGTNTVTIKELWDKGSDNSKKTLRIGQLTGKGKTYTVTRIGNNAFRYTRSSQFFNNYDTNPCFTDIILDESVKVIGAYAFDPNDTSQSSVLTFSGPGVEEIGDHAFNDMVAMTTVSLPKVKKLGCGVFYNTTSITNLTLNEDIENWNNGVLMDEFASDRSLTSFTIPACISELGRSGLPRAITSVEIPATVTKIGSGAFSWCPDLESVTIPAAVTEIGEGAFCNCDSLASVTFASGSQLKKIGDRAFSECKELAEISFPDSVTSFGTEVLKMNSSYGTKLKKVKLPKNIKEVPDRTFYDCVSLNSVTLPDDVRRIGEEAFRVVGFNERTGLSSLTIPDSVTQIGAGAFSGLPIFAISFPRNITVIPENVCYDCDSLLYVDFYENVTEIGRQAFGNCGDLTSIDIPRSVKKLGFEAFGACEKLTGEIVIPEGVTEIPDYLFYATAITKVSLPDGISEIGRSAFEDCEQLEEVRFPADLKTVEFKAFSDCYALKNVALPVGIKKIDLYAFSNAGNAATGDVTAYLPDTIEYVGLLAFSNFGAKAGYIFYGGSEEKAKTLRGGNDGNEGYQSITQYYNGKLRYPICNASWNVTDDGTRYTPFTLNNDEDKTVTLDEAYKGVITKVSGYGDDLYGFDSQGYRYEDTSAVIGGKLFSFDEYGRATEITGYEAGKTGIVGSDGVYVYLKNGEVQKAADSELFADNVITVEGEKYLLRSNGILGTGYYQDSSAYESGAPEAGITGWYFDNASAKLVWIKKADSNGNDTYYGKDLTTLLTGSYPNEDGDLVKYKNGRCTMLAGFKIVDMTGTEITRTTLYAGPDAGAAGKPNTAKLILLTLPDGVPLNPYPDVEWRIINNNPKYKGDTVITNESHSDMDIVVKAKAPGRAKIRVNATACVDGGAQVTYTKDCLVIVEDTNKYPSSVSITGNKHKIKAGEALQLKATVLPADVTAGTTLTWSSSNPGVATVDNTGLVRGIADGSATISATTGNGVHGTYGIAVGSAPVPEPEPVSDDMEATDIVLNKNEVSLYPAESFKLSATVNPAGAKDKTVTFTSSNPTVASVYDAGRITAGTPGTAVITAASKTSASVKAECLVTVLEKEIVDTDEGGNVIDPAAPGSGVSAYDADKGEAKIWIAGLEEDYYYTGNAIKPAIHVYKGYKLMTAGTDYTLKYKNNKNVSKSAAVNVTNDKKKPQIIITMKGAYTGSKTVYFNIVPMPLDKLEISDGISASGNVILTAAYKAKKKNLLKPVLLYDGAKIKYGKNDMTFKWFVVNDHNEVTSTESTCIDPGKYAVKIYAGSSGTLAPGSDADGGRLAATIIVDGKTPMSSVKVNGFKAKRPYSSGAEVTQPDTVSLTFKDKNGTHALSECRVPGDGGDYTVTYKNDHEPGTATVIYEAVKDEEGAYTGRYAGRLVKTYKITGKATLTQAAPGTSADALSPGEFMTVLGPEDGDEYEYTGAAIKPSITVLARVITNKSGAEGELMTLRQGKDYTVKYKNNTIVAEADAKNKKNKDVAPQVSIKGKGNYILGSAAGTVRRFAITPLDLSAANPAYVLTISDRAYSRKANDFKKATILITDRDYRSFKLKAGAAKDYSVVYATSDGSIAPAAGQVVTVTITGNRKADGTGTGNCTGEVTGSYRIFGGGHKDINKAKVLINPSTKSKTQPCTYTGSGIEPGHDGVNSLAITFGSGKNAQILTEKTAANPTGDYEILGYFNNVNKGNGAVVLIRGTGDTFRGVRAVKFKIASVKVNDRWGGIFGRP